jgi:ubiquitin-like-conjugating enzyme ATG3
MESIKNSAGKFLRSVAENFIPVRLFLIVKAMKDSKFLEKGLLTPEEFVIAGDHLTHKCPTWK